MPCLSALLVSGLLVGAALAHSDLVCVGYQNTKSCRADKNDGLGGYPFYSNSGGFAVPQQPQNHIAASDSAKADLVNASGKICTPLANPPKTVADPAYPKKAPAYKAGQTVPLACQYNADGAIKLLMRTTGHQNGHSSVWQATGALLSQVIAHKILRHLRTGKGDGSGVNSSFYIWYSPDADPSYDLFNTQPIAEMKWDDCVIKADTGYDSREGGDFVDAVVCAANWVVPSDAPKGIATFVWGWNWGRYTKSPQTPVEYATCFQIDVGGDDALQPKPLTDSYIVPPVWTKTIAEASAAGGNVGAKPVTPIPPKARARRSAAGHRAWKH